jgi:hypothetical protein
VRSIRSFLSQAPKGGADQNSQLKQPAEPTRRVVMGINPNHNQTVVRPTLVQGLSYNHNQTVVRPVLVQGLSYNHNQTVVR